MSEMTVIVERREETGKNVSRRLRAAGRIPAVVYGAGKDAVPISVDQKMMHEFLREPGSENSVFLLQLGENGETRHAMIREFEIDPISRRIEHIDFFRVLMDEKVKVNVPIELEGTPDGVKNQGGVLDFVTREIEVECLPGNIPQAIAADVSALEVGDHLEANQLSIPDGVELLTDPSTVLLSIAHSRVAETLEAAEEAAEEETLIEATAEEPEVIQKAKSEEEDEES